MLEWSGRVRPLTAHSKLEPLRDRQGASRQAKRSEKIGRGLEFLEVKCDSGKMLSQHAYVSSMKIFIRKSEHISVLESELSQRGINILHHYDVYQVFHKHTRLISRPPEAAPPQQPEAPGGLRRAGPQVDSRASRPPGLPVGGRGPSRGCDRKGNRISQGVTQGRRAELPFALSSPLAKRRSEKPGEK